VNPGGALSPNAPSAADHRAARRERGVARWRARSRLIRRLRVILPSAIAAVMVFLLGWVTIGGLLARMGDGHAEGQALIHMTNARFYGQDSGGRPFVLSAAEASRDDNDLKLVTMKTLTLTMDAGGAQSSRLSADRGFYREDSRVVRLNGHVTLQDASGDVFRTDQAIAHTNQGLVNGPSPVSGVGPSGNIFAQGFTIFDKGARVVFRGEVHSRLKRD
jgi:lipopolysaccharide export system protein LptC